jgi:peptidoglycan/LPS O-acetylase OafA/YrhL
MTSSLRVTHESYRETARFASLDGLRCLAILPVFWHHCTLGPLPGPLGRGPLGVDLFFAISGFLITTLLLRERDARERVSIRAFYLRRCLRIFPLYYGVLGLYVLNTWLLMPQGPQRAHFFRSLPFFATYTTDWFVDFSVHHPVSFAFAWSLAIEEQFYLVWPWVIALPRGVSRWLWPVAASLALLVLEQGVAHGMWAAVLPPGGLGRRMVGNIAAPICMGALLAQILHRRGGFELAYLLLGRPASAALLLVGLALCTCLDGVPLWLAQVDMTLLVGACSVRGDHSLAWLTDLAPVRWIGTVSYGIYLFHVGVITFARRVFPGLLGDPAWTFATVLPVTVMLASASFRWFEQPLLRSRQHPQLRGRA